MTKLFVAVEARRNQSIGTLIRCASAFGATSIIIVGSDKFSTHGSHQSHKKIQLVHSYIWEDCISYLKNIDSTIQFVACSPSKINDVPISISSYSSHSQQSRLVSSVSTDDISYSSSVCFIVADSKLGLREEILQFCEAIVWIRLPNQSKEHLLHFDTKLSLIFQSYAMNMHFPSTGYGGTKFDILESNDEFRPIFVSPPVNPSIQVTANIAKDNDDIHNQNEMEDGGSFYPFALFGGFDEES
jgi:hypothetical protein